MTNAVFLHIGLFKSGTTYLQNVLWNSRDALADEGILVPGRHSAGPAFAALDVMRVPASRRSPASYGAWSRFVGWINEWEGATAVVSTERLTFAGPRAIRRMLADLAPTSVHVMVTVRDLARVVPSSWQERVRNRKTVSWPDYLAAVIDPNSDEQSAKDFWRKQDAHGLLAKWAGHLPTQNITVITVPPSGSDPHLLPARFAEALGSDVSRWNTYVDTTNDALGITETEVLRRLNPRLPDQVTTPDYTHLVKLGLARHALGVRDGRRQVRIPAEHASWLENQAQRIIDGLREPGYRIVGDLDDLMPSAPTGPPSEAMTVSDDDMLDASLDVSAHLVARLADQLSESQQATGSQQATESGDLDGLHVPDAYADWFARHASTTLDDLRTRGYHVVGDSEQATLTAVAPKRPDEVTVPAGELLDTSLDINAYLVARLAETRS